MRTVLALFLGLIVLGCEKQEDRSCFKSVGGASSIEISLEEFNKIYMGPHIKYVLIQSDEEKVVIEGGKNLLNFIETSVVDKKLSITNNNKCNWLRSYDKVVTVYIYVKDIINIEFEGTHEVTCYNVLDVTDLSLTIRDGAGAFNLNVNGNSLHATITHGWGNFKLSGNVNYLSLDIRSNGFGDAYDLTVNDSLKVVSNTTELVKMNPNNCLLRAQSFSSGDIWYVGAPTFIEYNAYATGKLIDKN